MQWQNKTKVAEDMGITVRTLEGWLHKKLDKGVHWQTVGHKTLINVGKLNQWLNSQASELSAARQE